MHFSMMHQIKLQSWSIYCIPVIMVGGVWSNRVVMLDPMLLCNFFSWIFSDISSIKTLINVVLKCECTSIKLDKFLLPKKWNEVKINMNFLCSFLISKILKKRILRFVKHPAEIFAIFIRTDAATFVISSFFYSQCIGNKF